MNIILVVTREISETQKPEANFNFKDVFELANHFAIVHLVRELLRWVRVRLGVISVHSSC